VTFAFFASFGGYSSLTHTLTRLLIGREKAQKAQIKDAVCFGRGAMLVSPAALALIPLP